MTVSNQLKLVQLWSEDMKCGFSFFIDFFHLFEKFFMFSLQLQNNFWQFYLSQKIYFKIEKNFWGVSHELKLVQLWPEDMKCFFNDFFSLFQKIFRLICSTEKLILTSISTTKNLFQGEKNFQRVSHKLKLYCQLAPWPQSFQRDVLLGMDVHRAEEPALLAPTRLRNQRRLKAYAIGKVRIPFRESRWNV